MRAKSEYPTRHGDQHVPDGSDPVTRAVFMDYTNVGDYLHVITNGQDAAAHGWSLEAFGGEGFLFTDTGYSININSGADLNLLATSILDLSGYLARLSSLTSDVEITAALDVVISAGEDVSVEVATGRTFTVKDSAGNPKIQWTEGTNNLHIPTAGTVIADL